MTSINEANKPGNEFSSELGIEMGKKGAKQEYAYEYIKRAIVENRFAPEQCLNEKDLGIELGGLSRTPIRDALRKLVYEGMIDYVPGKGMFVSEIRFEDLLEVSEIRIPLEKPALSCLSNGPIRRIWKSWRNCMLSIGRHTRPAI